MLFKRKQLEKKLIPNHLAIIMDGNRRWATKRLVQRKVGHYEGAKNLKKIISECIKLEINYLTVYAFSTENWHRDDNEINELMELLDNFLGGEQEDIIKNGIKINILGDTTKFSKKIQHKLYDITNSTRNNTKLHFNIALNYGSREEIILAVNTFMEDKSKAEKLTEKKFTKYLYTKNIPDPDLMIRTSGEYRLSNFLLWQSAYSELYFTKKLWPEFNEKELHKALLDYGQRKRRFGR